jgi:hypothetical protein
MTKDGVKTWMDLAEFAQARASRSAKRNDPWAWAYWREAAKWATQQFTEAHDGNTLHNVPGVLNWLQGLVQSAEQMATGSDYVGAAKLYSRAKWLAIMLRNNGYKVPVSKGPSLKWLHRFEGQG